MGKYLYFTCRKGLLLKVKYSVNGEVIIFCVLEKFVVREWNFMFMGKYSYSMFRKSLLLKVKYYVNGEVIIFYV